MAEPKPREYIVVGGGPAGLTIARLLALRKRRVIVACAERRYANRLELLAPAAHRTVLALGLEALLLDKAIARPCLGIKRPEVRPENEDFFRHASRGSHVVDRARFDTCLRDGALAAGAEILPVRVTGVAPDGAALNVKTSTGAKGILRVNGIVIDATGRAAAIARRKGARIAFGDRMVAELIAEAPASQTQHDAENVPAWLVYQGDACNWSYCIQGPRGLTQTWRVRSSHSRSDNAIRRVDASACILSRAAGDGWIAVGDAAMSFNPIASQGLFNALSSALAAAGLLLSQEGLSPQMAENWSEAAAVTFLHSEMGRAARSSPLSSGMNPYQGP